MHGFLISYIKFDSFAVRCHTLVITYYCQMCSTRHQVLASAFNQLILKCNRFKKPGTQCWDPFFSCLDSRCIYSIHFSHKGIFFFLSLRSRVISHEQSQPATRWTTTLIWQSQEEFNSYLRSISDWWRLFWRIMGNVAFHQKCHNLKKSK